MAKNSDGKVAAANKAFGNARRELAHFMSDEKCQALMADLVKAGAVLDTPEEANLEPIFKFAEKVPQAVKAAKRAKSQKVLEGLFDKAYAQIRKYADKIDGGAELLLSADNASYDFIDLSQVEDLQKHYKLCDQIFSAVRKYQTEEIILKVTKSVAGWKSGKYGPMFEKTPVGQKVEIWLGYQPADDADFKEFKKWLAEGWDLLKNNLEAPWGYFKCTGHGSAKVKVLPIMPRDSKAFIPSECSACHQASHPMPVIDLFPIKKPTGHKKPEHKPSEHKTQEQLKAEKQARQRKIETDRLAAEAELQHLHPGQFKDGAGKKARDAAKEERKQGGHPEKQQKTAKAEKATPSAETESGKGKGKGGKGK